MAEFETYSDRKIAFLGTQLVSGWNIKVYTITLNSSFQATDTLNMVLEKLSSEFIQQTQNTGLPTHQHAFVVVHEAREGVWILFSWWTGGEMLETIVRFSPYQNPPTLQPSPFSNSLVCTWELEVFIHERQAWITHVLKQNTAPDFISYQKDGLNGK